MDIAAGSIVFRLSDGKFVVDDGASAVATFTLPQSNPSFVGAAYWKICPKGKYVALMGTGVVEIKTGLLVCSSADSSAPHYGFSTDGNYYHSEGDVYETSTWTKVFDGALTQSFAVFSSGASAPSVVLRESGVGYHVYDVITGALIGTVTANPYDIHAVALLGRDKLFLARLQSGSIRASLWNAATNTEIWGYVGGSSSIDPRMAIPSTDLAKVVVSSVSPSGVYNDSLLAISSAGSTFGAPALCDPNPFYVSASFNNTSELMLTNHASPANALVVTLNGAVVRTVATDGQSFYGSTYSAANGGYYIPIGAPPAPVFWQDFVSTSEIP